MVTPLENVAYDVYSLHEIVHINEKLRDSLNAKNGIKGLSQLL